MKPHHFQRKHYGPLAFWCLNHRLKREELTRQLDELKAKGFDGFFMHPRAGLLTPYGSEEWFGMVGFCIQHAKKIELEAWLYDEDPFPSGMAGGRVTLDHPEFQASYLRHGVREVSRPGHYDLDLPEGALVGAFVVHDGEIKRVDEYAGLVRTDWQVGLCSHSYYPPYSAQGSPHWRADAVNPRYRLAVEVKAAPATLIGFTRHYFAQAPWGAFADLMNPAAVACFLKLTHQEYYRRFGREFGRTIPGIFTDEPKVMGALPWSDHLATHFQAIVRRELCSCLPHLVREIDGDSLYLRWAYREAISRAFKAAFVDPIERYCEKVGIAFTGHISPEEDPVGQAFMTPGLMNWIGNMAIPAYDLVGADIGDARHPLLHLGPKLASSAAHTRGKTHVLCEALAVVDWVQDTAFMGKVINWLYALGVNLLTTHGQFYSIDGLRKREAPPSQFIPASYWEHFGALSQYVKNLSHALTEGRHQAPVLLYYPSEAFMALSEPADPHIAPPSQAEQLRDQLARLMDLLLTRGYDFDLVDAQALRTAKAVPDGIKVGDEVYATMVIPGGPLRQDAARVLRTLERRGARMVSLQKRLAVLGGGNLSVKANASLAGIVRLLEHWCSPIFRAKGRLLGHKRVTPNGVNLFLVNNDDAPFTGEVVLDFPGRYQIRDLQTGGVVKVAGALRFELEPGRGVLIQATKRQMAGPNHRRTSEWRPCLDISDGWTGRGESDNCLILNEFRMNALADSAAEGELERYLKQPSFALSGPQMDLLAAEAALATPQLGRRTLFQTSFECRGWRGPLHLVRDSQLGPPADRECSNTFRFFVNGREVEGFRPCRRYDPYNLQARIDRLVHEGRNFLVMLQTLPKEVPLEKGMPYDCVRLFGDFHAEFPFGRTSPAWLSPRPTSYLIDRAASPQQLGHPHYGGIFRYSRVVQVTEVPDRTALRFRKLHESAEVRLNGENVGVLWQPPHLIEIDSSRWRHGSNRLEVRFATSPANYLLAMGRPFGFGGPVELCG